MLVKQSSFPKSGACPLEIGNMWSSCPALYAYKLSCFPHSYSLCSHLPLTYAWWYSTQDLSVVHCLKFNNNIQCSSVLFQIIQNILTYFILWFSFKNMTTQIVETILEGMHRSAFCTFILKGSWRKKIKLWV